MIDFHTHLGKVVHGFAPLTPEKLLRFMDAHGIEKSVILPLVAPEEEDEDFDFEEALSGIHVELEDLNTEAVQLAAAIKKNFEELGI